MLLFRSEEHLTAWLEGGHPEGARMTLAQQWELAQHWFVGRNEPTWKKRTPSEAEAVLRGCGLTEEFWRFTSN